MVLLCSVGWVLYFSFLLLLFSLNFSYNCFFLFCSWMDRVFLINWFCWLQLILLDWLLYMLPWFFFYLSGLVAREVMLIVSIGMTFLFICVVWFLVVVMIYLLEEVKGGGPKREFVNIVGSTFLNLIIYLFIYWIWLFQSCYYLSWIVGFGLTFRVIVRLLVLVFYSVHVWFWQCAKTESNLKKQKSSFRCCWIGDYDEFHQERS